MLSLVIRHETRTLLRAPAFAWILLLLAAAMVFGAWSASQDIARRAAGEQAMVAAALASRDKMRSDVAAYEARLAESGEPFQIAVYSHSPRGPIPPGTNAGTVGMTAAEPAVLPRTELAAFATGQSDIQLAYLPVSTASIVKITQGSELGNPVNLQRGPFDIAFVVIYLLPIFILAISYDMLTSEKERGTLAMVLSHPIGLRKLMASKVITRGAIILAVVLAAGFGGLLATGADLTQAATWARFGLWLGATLLYGLFWFGLSVLVNALGRHSATNGLILAGAWLVLVVVVPTVVSVAATSAYPPPSRFDFITASRAAQTDSERSYMQALDQYFYDHVEYVPDRMANDFLLTTLAKNQAVEEATAPLFARFREQLARQDAAVAAFQYLSPAIIMQRALNEAAGTSTARYDGFLDQVIAFRADWVDFFTTRFLTDVPMTSAEYAKIPRFTYREEPISAPLGRALPGLLGMAGLCALIGFAAIGALRRYQIAGR